MSTSALKSIARGEVAPKDANPVVAFSGFLEKLKPQIQNALPKHLNAERMCRLALTSFSSNRALQQCEAKSIAASIITAAQLGLEPGVLGQGWLIPYKGKCTFVPGWQGLSDLVARSGRAAAWTGAVFEGDGFDYQLGDAPFVRHKPMGEDDPAKLLYTYSVGRVNGSEFPIIEVWPIGKIWRHRDRFNKVGGEHYSFKHPEMYARKIPLLQVIKYLPKSIELQRALEADQAAEIDGNTIDLDDAGNVVPTLAEIEDAMREARTLDQLDEAANLIPSLELSQQDRANALYRELRAILTKE